MMIACTVCLSTVHDLTTPNDDGSVGKDVVDAHPRALVEADEVSRDRIAPSPQGDRILQPQFGKGTEHLPPALDELSQASFGITRKRAERHNERIAVNVIGWTNAVKIAADDQRPIQTCHEALEIR